MDSENKEKMENLKQTIEKGQGELQAMQRAFESKKREVDSLQEQYHADCRLEASQSHSQWTESKGSEEGLLERSIIEGLTESGQLGIDRSDKISDAILDKTVLKILNQNQSAIAEQERKEFESLNPLEKGLFKDEGSIKNHQGQVLLGGGLALVTLIMLTWGIIESVQQDRLGDVIFISIIFFVLLVLIPSAAVYHMQSSINNVKAIKKRQKAQREWAEALKGNRVTLLSNKWAQVKENQMAVEEVKGKSGSI